MGNRVFGLTGNHIAITHLNDDSFATVGAHRLNPDQLTWEQPAHGQRLCSSLTEPLLLAVHANPVLVGQVRKWADRNDVVILVNPTWIPRCHQVMEDRTGVVRVKTKRFP